MISKRFRVIIIVFGAGVTLFPVVSTKECENLNKTRQPKEICGMVAPIWLPFAFEKSPIKEIVIIWQAGCALVNFASASAVTAIILEIMENFVIRVQHLKQLISSIIKVPESQLKSQLLAKWVQYHVFIKE